MLYENINDQREAYYRALQDLVERSDILDGQALERMKAMVTQMQERIAGRISKTLRDGRASEGWGPFWIPRLLNATRDLIQELGERTGANLEEFQRKSYELGADFAQDTINATSGVILLAKPEVSFRPRVTVTKLAVLSGFRTSLIRDISVKAREEIGKEIRLAAALGPDPAELQRRIEANLRDNGTPFRKIAQKAQTIMRTEVARVQGLGHDARTREILTEFPEIAEGPRGMKQLFVVVQRGEYPCKICAPFDGTVWEINDPNKPNPPTSTHPNCRCRLVNYWPGLSSKKRVPERPIKRQQRSSLSECVCCH